MEFSALYPFIEDADRLERYCKLPLHSGIGKIAAQMNPHPLAEMFRRLRVSMGKSQLDPTPQLFDAGFIVPATGNCLVFLRCPEKCPLSQNFWHGLTLSGDSPDGRFLFECPQFYVRTTSGTGEKPGWAVAQPVNQPATVTYSTTRPIAKVIAIINNFDYEYSNLDGTDKVLRVQASGRTVDFAWRKDRIQLRRLVDAEIIPSTAFVTFSFAAWAGASVDELTAFAHNIASLCQYVVGQHTSIPVLSFFDENGCIVRRTFRQAIQSKFRPGNILPCPHADNELGLPNLFRQCFDKHVRMQSSDLWKRLPSFCAAIEDPPYLEQKYASLMMAVELLIRSSLIEGGHCTQEQAESKTLPPLIRAAKEMLRWDIPEHYTEENRYKDLRNAIAHGNMLPYDATEVRKGFFDKWRLFLIRRILMRLGYTGKVVSPQKGSVWMSQVDDFSEEHNCFRPC